MNPVIVKNIRIGEGIPKICVPIVGKTREEILTEARELMTHEIDMVEWRADWYEDVNDTSCVIKIMAELRRFLGELPLLFTFRTQREGGAKNIEGTAYVEINKEVCASGLGEFIDVEIGWGKEIVEELIGYAHEKNIHVIASNHDFEKTPSKEEMIARLQKMQEFGADILKIAVMPHNKQDVLTLLSATEEVVTSYATQPVVTMAMSDIGAITRISGEIFGSAITFGTVGKASAPGQIPVTTLKKILLDIHDAI